MDILLGIGPWLLHEKNQLITVKNYEEKGLAYIFDEIITWTKKECSILFELTRKSIRGYDFLTNSIFACAVSLFVRIPPHSLLLHPVTYLENQPKLIFFSLGMGN